MKKKLDKNHILYKQKLYPYKKNRNLLKHQNSILLGIGGNIGDVRRRFNHLFISLQKSPYITTVETSPILKNPPFGYLNQNDFHNSLIYAKTSLEPKALLRYILRLEKKFKRKRSFQDAPRTLDIDIIFYNNITINTQELTIPHPAWRERSSVTIPMSYMKSLYIKKVNI